MSDELQEDEHGLFASCWIPETPLGDDMIDLGEETAKRRQAEEKQREQWLRQLRYHLRSLYRSAKFNAPPVLIRDSVERITQHLKGNQ